MNTPNNKRRKASRARIEKVFFELLQTRDLDKISVSAICKKAGLNRTTFYANYTDIYDLADTIREKLESNMKTLYAEEITQRFNSNDYLKLFQHIKENPTLYQTYFKLGYDENYMILTYDSALAQTHFQDAFIEYHIAFFKAGITRIIKMWLQNGCKESPEDLFAILKSEYQGRVASVDDRDKAAASHGEER